MAVSLKLRNGQQFKRKHGGKQDTEVEAARSRAERELQSTLEKCSQDRIYNADETGLYSSAFPDRGNTFNGDQLSGGKKSK